MTLSTCHALQISRVLNVNLFARASTGTVFQPYLLDYIPESQTIFNDEGDDEGVVSWTPEYLGVLLYQGIEEDIVQWIFAANMPLDYASVKTWAGDAMATGAGFNTGQDTIAAAGLVFCEAVDDCHYQMHSVDPQDEPAILVAFRSRVFASPPSVLYASINKAFQLLQSRNGQTAIMKAADTTRMQVLEREGLVVERCLTALQNVMHRLLRIDI